MHYTRTTILAKRSFCVVATPFNDIRVWLVIIIQPRLKVITSTYVSYKICAFADPTSCTEKKT